MAGTWHWYGNAVLKVGQGLIDLDTDTFKIMLTTSTYTPNQDTHVFRSDVTNEVTGTGYTAGGNTLTGVSVTYNAASHQMRVTWTGGNTWGSSTITARTAVIYKSRGGASTADELLAYCTESADITSTGGTFTVSLPSPTLTGTAS